MQKEPARGPLTLKNMGLREGRSKEEDVLELNVLYCKL